MNKKQAMYDRITRHGLSLLAVFPQATEQDPVKLCKKLRRMEAVAHQFATDWCNGLVQMEDEELDAACEKLLAPVRKLLGLALSDDAFGLFLNLDARGCALKLSSEWTTEHNRTAESRLYSDWGSYGILAPDLTKD